MVAPILGGDDKFSLDVFTNVFKTEFGFDLVDNSVTVSVLFIFPVNVLVDVRYRYKGLDGGTAFGSKTRVCDTGILDID